MLTHVIVKKTKFLGLIINPITQKFESKNHQTLQSKDKAQSCTSEQSKHSKMPITRLIQPTLNQKIKQINNQKALLIGGFGVGKSTIFQKTVKTSDQVQNDFQQSLIQKLTFTLIDSPPFDLDQSINLREKLIFQFSEFLNKEKADISTFFLVIKYDRIDVMKRSFYSIIKYFKQYRQKVGVIITFWDLRVKDQENDIKEKLQNFFFMCKIKLIGFLEQSTDPEIIQNMLTKGLTGEKGIDLQNTIFEIQQNTEQQDMIQILQKQIQQDVFLRRALQDQYIKLLIPQNQQQS